MVPLSGVFSRAEANGSHLANCHQRGLNIRHAQVIARMTDLNLTSRYTAQESEMDSNDIPKDMRSMAEAGFEQARKAFEKFLSGAQQAASTLESHGEAARANAKDISTKAMSFAEKNVSASLDHAQKLLQARDLSDIMRIHSEYVQTQMRNLAEQASEMTQAVSRAAMDAAKPKT